MVEGEASGSACFAVSYIGEGDHEYAEGMGLREAGGTRKGDRYMLRGRGSLCLWSFECAMAEDDWVEGHVLVGIGRCGGVS